MSTGAGALAVSARSLAVRYRGVTVLSDVDLDVHDGDHLALVGRSGSGKTTLLLALAGLVPPTSGRVSWPGSTPRGLAARRPAVGSIGMVFQAPSLMPELSAAENVALPLRLRGTDRPSAATAAAAALAAVGLSNQAGALPACLSGGQQQRVAVARVLAGRHRVVLADEPTGSLDRTSARSAVLALRDGVGERGGALVLATHDPMIAGLLDRVIELADLQRPAAGVR